MTSLPLMRLTSQGLAAVNADFLTGNPERLPDEPSFVTPLRAYEGATFGLPRLELPDRVLGPKDDPAVAVALHGQLGIRRGVATDVRMWAWLATRHVPTLIRRRWSVGGKPPRRNRFVGRIVDNGLSRLWWAAELTGAPGVAREEHTQAISSLLSSQYRTDRLLSMPLLRHPPILLGVLDVIGTDRRWQVLNEICRRLGILATTYSIETMSRDEVRTFVGRIHSDVMAGREFSSQVEPDL